jgi:hypothetical protein
MHLEVDMVIYYQEKIKQLEYIRFCDLENFTNKRRKILNKLYDWQNVKL